MKKLRYFNGLMYRLNFVYNTRAEAKRVGESRKKKSKYTLYRIIKKGKGAYALYMYL